MPLLVSPCTCMDGTKTDSGTRKNRELVAKSLQLPLVHAGGGGLTPYHKVCHAAYAASWFQPAETIAAAHNVSDKCLVDIWNTSKSSASIAQVKLSVIALGLFGDLKEMYHSYHEAKQVHMKKMLQRIEMGKHAPDWQMKFHFQKFLAKGLWKMQAEGYIRALVNSGPPFRDFEKESIMDRDDKFAPT